METKGKTKEPETVKVMIDVNVQSLWDAAGDADISYWANCTRYCRKRHRLSLTQHEDEKKSYKLTTDDLAKGLSRMLVSDSINIKKLASWIINNDSDAESGDVLIQYACFGELIYG